MTNIARMRPETVGRQAPAFFTRAARGDATGRPMKAVIIGTGRVGCGFVGQVLRASGYEVVFLGREPSMLECLNKARRYYVHLVDGRSAERVVVDGVRAVSVQDADRAVQELAGAGLIATAVGSRNLPEVASLIAMSLRQRSAPANVIAFENSADAGRCLRNLVASQLPADFPVDKHGFSGAVLCRVISDWLRDKRTAGRLVVIGEPVTRFAVDGRALRAPLPAIEGMVVTNDFAAWFERKLYVFLAGHAVCAYLGFLRGHAHIHAAIADAEIRAAVIGAMREGQKGIAARYGSGFAGGEGFLRKIVSRFENSALNDSILRVAREPVRKLQPRDRLVGAARLAEAAGICPENLALGMAAALQFCHPADPISLTLRRDVELVGVDAVLRRVSGIKRGSSLGRLVAAACSRTGAITAAEPLSKPRVGYVGRPRVAA